MPTVREKDNEIEVTFHNHSDLLHYLQAYPQNLIDKEPRSRADHMDFDFTPYSWDDSMQALESGWAEGSKKIEKYKTQIRERLTENEVTYQVEYDVTGDYIDVGRVMEGHPECWGAIYTEHVEREEVDVVIHVGGSSGVSADDIYMRGAVIASTIDQLKNRYQMNVRFVSKVNNCLGKMITVNYNLDMVQEYSRDLLAFYCAHPSMLRRITFAVREVVCNAHNCRGYGYTMDIIPDKTSIYFQSIDNDDDDRVWSSIETATERVRKIVESYSKDKEVE